MIPPLIGGRQKGERRVEGRGERRGKGGRTSDWEEEEVYSMGSTYLSVSDFTLTSWLASGDSALPLMLTLPPPKLTIIIIN